MERLAYDVDSDINSYDLHPTWSQQSALQFRRLPLPLQEHSIAVVTQLCVYSCTQDDEAGIWSHLVWHILGMPSPSSLPCIDGPYTHACAAR